MYFFINKPEDLNFKTFRATHPIRRAQNRPGRRILPQGLAQPWLIFPNSPRLTPKACTGTAASPRSVHLTPISSRQHVECPQALGNFHRPSGDAWSVQQRHCHHSRGVTPLCLPQWPCEEPCQSSLMFSVAVMRMCNQKFPDKQLNCLTTAQKRLQHPAETCHHDLLAGSTAKEIWNPSRLYCNQHLTAQEAPQMDCWVEKNGLGPSVSTWMINFWPQINHSYKYLLESLTPAET